jgi:hypothetical protein
MEVKGILRGLVGSQSGISQRTGNPWKTDEWLLVIPGAYEKKIKFEVRGEERCKQWQNFFNGMPDKNQPVAIKFEIDAREIDKDGVKKWINSVEAWDISITSW